jgi:large subunit ribosomal protein L32
MQIPRQIRKVVAMANPKRRHSQKRTSTRRAHDFLTAKSLSECPNCHETKLPHRACAKCGYYKGREVVATAEKAN